MHPVSSEPSFQVCFHRQFHWHLPWLGSALTTRLGENQGLSVIDDLASSSHTFSLDALGQTVRGIEVGLVADELGLPGRELTVFDIEALEPLISRPAHQP